VAAAIASSDAGSDRRRRGNTIMSAVTSATRMTAANDPAPPIASRAARHATTAVLSPSGLATPSAAGTCWRKMMVAIPIVKPSITGQGMYANNRPTRANAAITISAPASTPTT
jgi:hypothetical protein